MSKWQPIETAPMDGSDILTWTNLGGEKDEIMVMRNSYGEGWSGGGLSMLLPTHWMPLPEPPKGE